MRCRGCCLMGVEIICRAGGGGLTSGGEVGSWRDDLESSHLISGTSIEIICRAGGGGGRTSGGDVGVLER